MSLWVCAACTTAYSAGAPRCPHCAGTDYSEEGQPVGKISKHAGATVVGEVPEPEPASEVTPVPEPEPVPEVEAEPEPAPKAEPVPAPQPAKKTTAKRPV
jgi:hypothetical protein